MKLIGILMGTATVRVSPEDVSPPNGIPWPQLTAALTARYKFSASMPPPIAGGINQMAPWLMFQSGEFELQSGKAAIQHLGFTRGGALIIAQSTDVADAALVDLIAFLDQTFAFRISSSPQKRNHISDVVVGFDHGIEEYLDRLQQVENLIDEAVASNQLGTGFRLKRLSFGREGFDPTERPPASISPLDAVESSEFVIERRVGHPYAENRYFCRAPLRTQDHIAALEAIERVIATSK